ncbi:hypothetical protein FVEN_g5966 [Fusarium venenatum]|uniref:Uncharacterized protein n=1 Tax=Fusarium venenatum TaxID=56646 RepID=A0A2L2SUW8_9HYPO|nr:uncharacterized protein FVRRES_05750 [Fusarium venenatum]KAG8356094.1 hypothetical protein FVEN_g5966 [Fusarium venenatum]KAH6992799.1 hypothetical protein EDB82DRAFT_574471 [Fusarium venenatum]CEI61314.1 unnamed protein product [Fusarium venenatum]
MPVFSSNTDMEIPGMDAEACASSADHLSSVKKFGRKWYAAGFEAGLAQATNEAEVRPTVAPTRKSEDSPDLIASLVARNEELEKELKGKDKGIVSFKKAAIDVRDYLVSAHNDMVSIIERSSGVVPDWLEKDLYNLALDLDTGKIQCAESIIKSWKEYLKPVSESHGSSGSSKLSKDN